MVNECERFAFVGLGLVSDSLYALAAGSVANVLRRKRRVVRYFSGSVYVTLGAVASLAKRSQAAWSGWTAGSGSGGASGS